ncbi:MAG: bifunctional hydroxymethylpyrimidine kinase/phosphomethylpyrimidine kinase [Spirochaetaceae bacterium]|jgi:hydroxymethylpyrimidine/phosphomethylpyrimidine kinase|nr:bifunctional hydroxymethylpyrimidine kinase/phosphomethylpyrimidine kinase [Spirochaetaceae bacterium]
MKNVLTIAGSDPSGGAGFQADLKTMCALGVYGMTVITAVIAQNTCGVYRIQEMEAGMVTAQIDAVFDDIRVDAVKVGMVSNAAVIRAIREGLLKYGAKNIVIDPVMVAKSGDPLLRPEAVTAVRDFAVMADILTPNIPEAEILAGFPIKTEEDMRRAASVIAERGAKNVLIKGGHRTGNSAGDLLLAGGNFVFLRAGRINTKNTHGTGCTLSSAIACRLALGDTMDDAVRAAKDYITQAIVDSYEVGKGNGPVGHLAALYRRAGMDMPEEV